MFNGSLHFSRWQPNMLNEIKVTSNYTRQDSLSNLLPLLLTFSSIFTLFSLFFTHICMKYSRHTSTHIDGCWPWALWPPVLPTAVWASGFESVTANVSLGQIYFFLCLGWPLEVCFMKWDVKRHGHWQQMVQQPYTSSSWWLEPEVQTFHCSKIFHSPSARNLSARPARQFLAGDLFTCPSTTIVPCETCVTCPCFSCWSPYTHHTPQKEPTLLWPQREQCRVIGVVVPARTTAIWFNRDGHKLVGKVHLFRPLGCWPNPSPQVWAPR